MRHNAPLVPTDWQVQQAEQLGVLDSPITVGKPGTGKRRWWIELEGAHWRVRRGWAKSARSEPLVQRFASEHKAIAFVLVNDRSLTLTDVRHGPEQREPVVTTPRAATQEEVVHMQVGAEAFADARLRPLPEARLVEVDEPVVMRVDSPPQGQSGRPKNYRNR